MLLAALDQVNTSGILMPVSAPTGNHFLNYTKCWMIFLETGFHINLDCEQSLFCSKIRGEKKPSTSHARAAKPRVARVAGDERKERLQWFHTTIVKLFDSSCLSQLRPFLNMIPDNSCFYFTPSHDQPVERMSLKIHISVKHFPAE